MVWLGGSRSPRGVGRGGGGGGGGFATVGGLATSEMRGLGASSISMSMGEAELDGSAPANGETGEVVETGAGRALEGSCLTSRWDARVGGAVRSDA